MRIAELFRPLVPGFAIATMVVVIVAGSVYVKEQTNKKNIFCDGPVVQVGQSLYRQCIVEQ